MAGNNSNERTIYVSNFDQKMTQNLLKEIFIQVGPVDGVSIRDRYAFVEFSDVESVLFACQLMDGIELFGKKMKVIPRDGSKQKEIYLRDGMKRKSDEIHRGNQQSTGHDQFQQRQNRNSAPYPNHPVVMPNPVQIVEAYGDRPVPIGEVRFTRSDGWPPTQQQHAFVAPLPLPFFNQCPPPPPPPAPSPWLTNNAPSSSNISVPPWEVNRARSGHINPMLAAPPPPPPVPPVFYQPRVESVNEKLDKDGGRYRPHHPHSSSNKRTNNQRQQNQDWKQQQERRNHPYKRPNSRNDNYRNGGRSL